MGGFGKLLRENREAFVTNIKTRIQYFNDNSSLRSIGYVTSLSRTPILKRLFWLVTFSACCYGTAVTLRGALGLYSQDAVSYSVETDFLQWDTAFPAVTICEQINEKNVRVTLIENNYRPALVTFAKEISFWNTKFCKTCVTCQLNVSCTEDFLPILELVRSPCEKLMTDCWFNGEHFPCCERFKPTATEYGMCFVFNSKLTGDGQLKVNRKVGLPSLLFTVLTSVGIKVHSPQERVSVVSENILGDCYILNRGANFKVNLMAEEIVNDISVRSIPPESRDCLYEDEVLPGAEGWPYETYSYSACAMYCRVMAQVRVCNCTYHFMPKIDKIPVCNIDGLKCLYLNQDSLETVNCRCPMSCEEVTYKVTQVSCLKNTESQVIQGTVTIGQLPHLRVRRHAIRDMLGLVVDFGGVVGVFFGASLLSFLEIVYIFFIRKYP